MRFDREIPLAIIERTRAGVRAMGNLIAAGLADIDIERNLLVLPGRKGASR